MDSDFKFGGGRLDLGKKVTTRVVICVCFCPFQAAPIRDPGTSISDEGSGNRLGRCNPQGEKEKKKNQVKSYR